MTKLHLDSSPYRPSFNHYHYSIVSVWCSHHHDDFLETNLTRKHFNPHARVIRTRHWVESNVSCLHVMTQGVVYNGVQI